MGVHAGFSPIAGAAAISSPGGARLPSFAAGFEASADMESILQVTRNLSMSANAGAVLDADISGVGQLSADFTATVTLEAELASAIPTPDGAYWKFDDLTGVDETSNHNLGDLTGMGVISAGPVDNQFTYGVNQYSTLSASTDFVGGPGAVRTYCFWCNPLLGGYVLDGKNGLRVQRSGGSMIIRYIDPANATILEKTIAYSSGVSHHLRIQFGGEDSADSQLEIWLDDVKDVSAPTTGAGVATNAAQTLTIGALVSGSFDSRPQMDDFRIYLSDITDAQGTAIFELGTPV